MTSLCMGKSLRLLVSLSILVGALVLCELTDVSAATTYYVATTGNDTTGVGSQGNPWRNPKRCLTAGVFQSGDICHVGPGTFTGVNARWWEPEVTVPNGTPGNYTTLEGEGVGVTIIQTSGFGTNVNDPSWLKFRNFTWDNVNTDSACFRGARASGGVGGSNIVFEDLECKNAGTPGAATPSGGIFISDSDPLAIHTIRMTRVHIHHIGNSFGGHCMYLRASNITVEYSEFNNCQLAGFQIVGNGQIPADTFLVRYNYIHHAGTSGIAMAAKNGQTYGNIFTANASAGITDGYTPRPTPNQHHNNIFYNNGGGIDCGQFGPTGGGSCVLKNNVIIGNSSYDVRLTNGWTTTGSDKNACSTAETDCGTNKITISAITDVTVSTTDFTHKVGGAGINAGTTVSTRSCNGVCDLGPFETFAASAPATAAASGNTVDVLLSINQYVPVRPATGQATWTVKFGGIARNTVSAVKLTGSDSIVRITYDGAACAPSDVMTIDYTSGTVTDSALIGGTLNQKLFSFTGLAVNESNCGGTPPPPPSGPEIVYPMTDGSGTTVTDSSGNGNNGTTTGSPQWVTGLLPDGALDFDEGVDDYITVPWGSGINPTTQSASICLFLSPKSTGPFQIFAGSPVGASQRAYISARDGTWSQGVQTSAHAVNNDFPIQAGYALVCQVFDSATPGGGTGTATLWVNAVKGTSAQSVKTYTTYSWSGNWTIGKANGESITFDSGSVVDHVVFYEFALNQTEMTELFQSLNNQSPPGSGTREQKGHKFQRPFKKAGVAEDLRGVDEDGRVVRGGYVDVVIQLDCTDNDCDSFAPRLHRSLDGGATYAQINDICGVICFRGTATDPNLVTADVECCLTGALTEVDGPTNVTSSAVPNIELTEDSSITLRYKLKVDASATPGQDIYLKVFDQNGNEMEGGYTPALGAKLTVKDYANGGGF